MRLCARILLLAISSLTALYPPSPEQGISLVRSTVPGIVDLYYEGELVNNLAVIVAFGGHYNNSEIQHSEVHLSESTISYSPFDSDEPWNPASHAQVNLRYRIEGDTLHVWSDQPIGLGLFFGLHHGVDRVTLAGGEELCPEGCELTPNYELGHFEQYEACGFTLNSIYDLPDICVRSHDGNRVDVETRNCPWCPEQEPLYDDYREMSGNDAWFEAGIAFGTTFELTFIPHPGAEVRRNPSFLLIASERHFPGEDWVSHLR